MPEFAHNCVFFVFDDIVLKYEIRFYDHTRYLSRLFAKYVF